MRLLLLHCDSFSFRVTDETPVAPFAPELNDGLRAQALSEVLVVLTTVEAGDERSPDDVVEQAIATIAETAEKLACGRVLVYPYAHLSSDLAKPKAAVGALDAVRDGLTALERFEIHRAPFGYYKAFTVACKGHPLSELAVTLVPRPIDVAHDPVHDHGPYHGEPTTDSRALLAEKDLRSEWRIYMPDGTFTPADEFDFAAFPGLADLYAYEISGTRAAEASSPHIKLMREQELVDYEPASDTGNLRWYPKGILVKRLLERRATDIVADFGAMEVETPIMYDYQHPALSKYLDRFPARQYLVKSDEDEFFLRFAACFGQYMIQHDMVTSYRDLPMRLYELTHFSFRREQGGEVAGLRRLRAFTMPDMHSLVRDMPMARGEFLEQVKLCIDWLDDLELDSVPAIRFVRSFLDDNTDFVKELMAAVNRPALIEVWDERFFYFVAKFEMNFVDTAKKAACLSTVQIDVENTERFSITFTGEDGASHHPLLMHTSVSGSIDRNLFALLETQAARIAAGQRAEWPVWLAPTQARLVPVSDAHLEGALDLAARLPFRVDVDDRDEKLGKKIRQAAKEWVPYTVVVGDRELVGADLTVRDRQGEHNTMSVDEFTDLMSTQTAGMPTLPLNTPKRLSRCPIFVG